MVQKCNCSDIKWTVWHNNVL